VLADRRKQAGFSTFYDEELREAQERTDAAFGDNIPPSPREPVYRAGDDVQNARMAQLTNLARQQVTLEEQQIIDSITTVIGMVAQVVEIGANTMDFHMIETQDLSVEVQRAVDNEEFSIALRHMLQQGGGELFKNPYISIGTLVMSLVMKNHTRILNAKVSGRTPARLKHDAEKLREEKAKMLEKRRERVAKRQRRLDEEAARAAAPSIEQKMNARIDEVRNSMKEDMAQLISAVNAMADRNSSRKSSRQSSRASSRQSSRRSSRRGSSDDEESPAEKPAEKPAETSSAPPPAAAMLPIAEDDEDDLPLSEAPTIDAAEAREDLESDASSQSSDVPPDDQLITAPAATASNGMFDKIIGGVAPLVERMNESGKREDARQAEADDIKDRMRRLNIKF
jgi:hypothetical protein